MLEIIPLRDRNRRYVIEQTQISLAALSGHLLLTEVPYGDLLLLVNAIAAESIKC